VRELEALSKSERQGVMGMRMIMHPSLLRFDPLYRAHMTRHEKDCAAAEFERGLGVRGWDDLIGDDEKFVKFLLDI
jgi:hypothetical protein